MLSCLAFIAYAQTLSSFVELHRGATRLELGKIGEDRLEDSRTFLKKIDNFNYYLVESLHSSKRIVEKVPQLGLEVEFCSMMNVDFTQQAKHLWSFKGRLNSDNDLLKVSGLVDTSKSHFYNHTWIEVPKFLSIEVIQLPQIDLESLDLSAVTFCEEEPNGIDQKCKPNQDLNHLKN
jgi:hypothetical protein